MQKDVNEQAAIAIASRSLVRLLPLSVRSVDFSASSDPMGQRAKLYLPLLRSCVAMSLLPTTSDQRGLYRSLRWSIKKLDDQVIPTRVGTYASALFRFSLDIGGGVSADLKMPNSGYEPEQSSLDAEIAHDIDKVSNQNASALDGLQLWSEAPPEWYLQYRGMFESSLRSSEIEGWQIWLPWFKDQELGLFPERRLWRSVFENNDLNWEQTPAEINKRLSELLKGENLTASDLETPAERPSPVNFEMNEGVLHPVLDETKGRDSSILVSARNAIEILLADILEEGIGRQHGRVRDLLKNIQAAIGDELEDVDAIFLGVFANRLTNFAERADEVLIPEHASEVIALDLELSRFLSHFPEWIEYSEQMSAPFSAPNTEQLAVSDAKDVITWIAKTKPEIITDETLLILETLGQTAKPPVELDEQSVAPAINRRSYLRACRSALRAIALYAIKIVRNGTEKAGEKVVQATLLGAGGSVALATLASRLPKEFGWLKSLIEPLSKFLGF